MSKPTALGANIFAGGFSLGVSKHFKLLGHLEHDDGYGAEVSRANLGIPIFIGKEEWPEKVKGLDFLYSNPPCAIWSVAGAKIGGGRPDWRLDPRLQRIKDIFSLVDRYKPYVWCWESVCQAFSKGREFVEEIADEAKKRGYSATYVLIDAQYLGVAQVRKRFFLVLHNVHIDWEKARPDFGSVITAGEALRGVRPQGTVMKPTPGEMKMVKIAKPGQRLSKVYDRTVKKPKIGSRGQMLGRPSFLKHKLDPGRPSNTVIGNSIFHHKENRFLAVNECAALSGFPQTWKWPKSDAHNLLARGVMPPVGEWLARQVAAAIKRKKRITKPVRYLVDFRQAPGVIHDVDKLPESVDLDWRPDKLVHTNKSSPSGRGRKAGANSGAGRLQAGQAGRAQARARRDPLALDQLAEATRRGVPDKEGQRQIREALAGLRRGKLPASSGMLIRARLLEAKMADSAIVIEVLKRYPDRKTTVADVNYHRYKMRRAGMI